MGTRADYYVGRGENATWLGSMAWDGYPSAIDMAILEATSEDVYRELVREYINNRDDGTLPEHGWPWPWNDSRTTDFAYTLDEGQVWASRFGGPWQKATEWDDKDSEEKSAEFPDMSQLKNMQYGRKSGLITIRGPLGCIIALVALCVSSCANHETITTEHHGKTTLVHHKRKVSNGTVDRIEAIDSKGAFSEAEIHVYDVGRLPLGDQGVEEAHRVYVTVKSKTPDLRLPSKVSSGPRTVWTPPNAMPVPQDQRIDDAVTEAQVAKKKLEDARTDIEKKLSEDNSLRGQLQEVEDRNQQLTDQLSAAMSAGTHKPTQPTEAEKAANDQLANWGKSQQP